MGISDIEIVINDIRYISDKDAASEISAIFADAGGRVSIAEIAERTYLPFEQIERIVNKWSW